MNTKIYTEEQLELMVNDLHQGLIVSIPTDTVMGLAARCDLETCLEQLYLVKQRQLDKPFPIMVADIEQLRKVVNLTERDEKLVNRWFPGPITFIFNKTSYIDDKFVNNNSTLAVRIPDDSLLRKIVKLLAEPIFLTSANKSDQPNTANSDEVMAIFENEIASIIEGKAMGHQASTIIDATGDDLVLLREGAISLKEVIESLEE